MKKIVSLILTVLLLCSVASIAVSAIDENVGKNRPVNIYEIKTAPVIDGKVGDKEYYSIFTWPGDSVAQGRGDYIKNLEASAYMCYDADYLYYAVVTECDDPHVAFADNDAQHWIFNAHHLMTTIIPDVPTKEIYPTADKFDWGVIFNGGYCYEWTLIFDSKTKKAVMADHFSALSAEKNVKYAASSEKGFDTYEIAIPWTSMKSKIQPTALTAKEGTVFGFDFTLGLTDIGNGYDGADNVYKGNYLYFGGEYAATGAKNLNGAAVVTLAGKYTPPVVDESKDASKKPVTPPTSDSGIIALAVIAGIAVAGAFIVKKFR